MTAPKKPAHKTLVAQALDREMFEIITGKKSLDLPTDTQLENMRAFQTVARQYQQQMAELIMTEPRNAKHRKEIEAAITMYEMRWREYAILASQVARDAAPFYHPRLSAIALHGGGRQNTQDSFDMLLEEINRQPRMKVIEQRKKDEEAA